MYWAAYAGEAEAGDMWVDLSESMCWREGEERVKP